MEKTALRCSVCGGDGRDGWIRCRKHGAMICMKCCDACPDHKEFSGLFSCKYDDSFSSRIDADIRQLESQIRRKDLQIRLAIRSGEEEVADKAREERQSIERQITRKKSTLQGYSRADR